MHVYIQELHVYETATVHKLCIDFAYILHDTLCNYHIPVTILISPFSIRLTAGHASAYRLVCFWIEYINHCDAVALTNYSSYTPHTPISMAR